MNYEMDKVDKVLLEKDLIVTHKIDEEHFMDKPHFHDGLELHFTLTNNTTYYIDDRKFVTNSGAVALFNSEQIHRVVLEKNQLYERYFVLFKSREVEEYTSKYHSLLEIYSSRRKNNVIQLNTNEIQRVKQLFDSLIEADKANKSEFSELKIKIRFIELLIYINELFFDRENPSKIIDYEHNQRLSEIVLFIQSNYMKTISLDLICEKFFVSKSTVIRMFKNIIGMTPNQYLIYVRIMKSRKLLEEGYSVRTVATKVGYNDESSFIKKFREIQGESPKQYSLKFQRSKYYE